MNAATHAGHGADVEVALTALWGALRLAVLDVETCNGSDGDHIIDLAVLTYRQRRLVGTWSRRFQPGVPVDAGSQAVHGFTDADLARERPFGEVVAEVAAVLTPADGERLVLVAHNVPFDADALLAAAMAGRKARTGTIKAAGKTRRRERQPDEATIIDLPEEHTAGHAQLLPARPSRDELAAWLAQVAECARLRCPYLDDRVATAGLPPVELLEALEPALAAALSAPDVAGAATVLGALRPLLAALPNRTAALRWFKK